MENTDIAYENGIVTNKINNHWSATRDGLTGYGATENLAIDVLLDIEYWYI